MGNAGEQIKEARMKRGLTQQELGDLIGISKHTVIKYEKNEREPNLETLTKLINLLDLDFWDIAPIEKIELEPGPAYEEGQKFYETIIERMNRETGFEHKRYSPEDLKRLRALFTSQKVSTIKSYVDIIHRNLDLKYSIDTKNNYRRVFLEKNSERFQKDFYKELREKAIRLIDNSLEEYEEQLNETINESCRSKVKETIAIIKSILDKNKISYEFSNILDYSNLEIYMVSEILKLKIHIEHKNKAINILELIAHKEIEDIYVLNDVKVEIIYN